MEAAAVRRMGIKEAAALSPSCLLRATQEVHIPPLLVPMLALEVELAVALGVAKAVGKVGRVSERLRASVRQLVGRSFRLSLHPHQSSTFSAP